MCRAPREPGGGGSTATGRQCPQPGAHRRRPPAGPAQPSRTGTRTQRRHRARSQTQHLSGLHPRLGSCWGDSRRDIPRTAEATRSLTGQGELVGPQAVTSSPGPRPTRSAKCPFSNPGEGRSLTPLQRCGPGTCCDQEDVGELGDGYTVTHCPTLSSSRGSMLTSKLTFFKNRGEADVFVSTKIENTCCRQTRTEGALKLFREEEPRGRQARERAVTTPRPFSFSWFLEGHMTAKEAPHTGRSARSRVRSWVGR